MENSGKSLTFLFFGGGENSKHINMFQTIFPAQESRREQQAILEQQAEAAREAAHVSRSEGGPQVQRFQES